MSHTIGVHKNSHRLPGDVHQTDKLSKLLLLLESGNHKEYKGKTLDENKLNLEEDLLDSEEKDDTNEDNEDEAETIFTKGYRCREESTKQNNSLDMSGTIKNNIKIKKGKQRILVPWTAEQKKIVKKFFSKHIKEKKPPKRCECEQLKTASIILENKTS